MDLALTEHVVTVLTWGIQLVRYTGAALFLLFIAWCGLMGAVTFTLFVLKHMLRYAWQRTLQAHAALRDVRSEIATFRLPSPPLVHDGHSAYGSAEPTPTPRDRDARRGAGDC